MLKKLIRYPLIIINSLFIIVLLLSYLAHYIPPSISSLVAFCGMAFPYLISIFIILSLAFLLFKQYKIFFINLLAILLAWNNIALQVQFHFKDNNNKEKTDFKLMSYNVKVFDLYNWAAKGKTKDSIVAFIKTCEPNIISFQEFYYDKDLFKLKTLSEHLNMPYYYVSETPPPTPNAHFGIALMSQYPIIKSQNIKLPNTSNMAYYCDVLINKDTIRIFGCHLESYRFTYDDYEMIAEAQKVKKQNLEELKQIQKYKPLVKRLKQAMIKRSYQAEKIASMIASSPHPVILTGDFNDTPASYTYHQLSRNLTDAFVESGFGLSHTYQGSFPSFRIDYILHSPQLKSFAYERYKVKLSDHYPISCSFKLK